MLVHPGSRGNLIGDKWMKSAFNDAVKAGLGKELKETKREKELKVSGVGKHHEVCPHTT